MAPLRAGVRRIRSTARDSGRLWTASLIADRFLPFGLLGLWPERTVSAEALAKQVESILRAWGMSSEHASITVDHLLYADLRGIDSHGCAMLLHYERGYLAGSLNLVPRIEVVMESDATALMDGGGGLGHVPADAAMRMAIAKGGDVGVGVVAVRNSGHYGAAGIYASMAASSGLIGVSTTSTEVPALVPTFGAEAMLGTNPIAISAPAGRNRPFLLDMATSTASVGKIVRAWRTGRSIPAGWALDRGGKPVTSGRRAFAQRRLTPLGGSPETGSHKGYGLAAAVEILSAVLAGTRSKGDREGESPVGHFFLAIDPARFRADGGFGADLDLMMDSLRATARLDPNRPVLVAGDPEHTAYEERSRSGIPLARGVVEDIRAVARACGAPFILDADA